MDTAQLTQAKLFSMQRVISGHFIVGNAFCSLENQVLRTFPGELTCFASHAEHFFVIYGSKLAIFKDVDEPYVYEIPSDLKPRAIQVSDDYIAIATEFPEITFQIYQLQQSKLKRVISVQVPYRSHRPEQCQIQIINRNFLVAYESQAFHIVLYYASSYYYADVLPVVPGRLVGSFGEIPRLEQNEVFEKQNDAKQTSIVVKAENFESCQLQQNLQFLKQTTADHLDVEQPKPEVLHLMRKYTDDSNNIVETPEYFQAGGVAESPQGVASSITASLPEPAFTDGEAYLQQLQALRVLDLQQSLHLTECAVSAGVFVLCDRRYGLIFVPEIVPPQSLANILHPQRSVSYVWKNAFRGVLTAAYFPLAGAAAAGAAFGFADGAVYRSYLIFKRAFACRQLFLHQDRLCAVFEDACGFITDKAEFDELLPLACQDIAQVGEAAPQFLRYLCAQQFNARNLLTPGCNLAGFVRDHRATFSTITGETFADPVLCSARAQNFAFTGHVSGYIRIFSDFQGQFRLIQRLRLSTVGILCISASVSHVVCSDAAGAVFFVSGVEKEFTVLGYAQVGEFGGITRSFGDFVAKCKADDHIIVEDGVTALPQTGLDSQILRPADYKTDQAKQFYFQATPLRDIYPLAVPHVRNGVCYAIVAIQVCQNSIYIAQSNGVITKLQFPAPERVLTQLENQNILKLGDLKETLQASSQRELEMLEGRFLQMETTNQIALSELKPITLRTCLAITSLYVDECAVPPPLVVSDLVYTGLADGRVFVFIIKSDADYQSGSKIDFPLLYKEIVKMRAAVCSISLLNGVIGVSDESGAFLAFQAVRPQLAYLKKIGLLYNKNDDVVQNLVAGEVDFQEIKATFEPQKAINQKQQTIVLSSSDAFVYCQLIRQQAHTVELVYDKDTLFADVHSAQGESYRIRLPASFTAATQAACEQIEQFVKQFVVSILYQQSSSDQTQISRQYLKHSYERRLAARSLKVDYNLLQLTLSIPTMDENGDGHQFQQIITQKFNYLLRKTPKQPYNAPEDPQTGALAQSLSKHIQERKDLMSLTQAANSLELPFASVPRALQLLISSHLRVRINERLIEESQKIAESLQEIDRQNEQILAEKQLQVIAKTATLPRIAARLPQNVYIEQQEAQEAPNGEQSAPQPPSALAQKLLKATHYIPEAQIHVSQRAVGFWRARFTEKYAEYERAYKGDILRAKAFQALHEKNVLANAGEAVSGLLDKKSYVPGFAFRDFPRPRKLLMLRTAQIACYLFERHQPIALVRDANGMMVRPNENVVAAQNSAVFETLVNVSDSKPENSGTLSIMQNYGMHVFVNSEPVREVTEGAEYVNDNYRLMPPASLFALPQCSHKAAIYHETQVTAPLRARQQSLLYRYQVDQICREANQALVKIRDQKFRNINKIQEIAQQIKDIGKELFYHAKEETLTQMIEQQRRQLVKQYQDQGLAIEECCARAAKNCVQQLPQDEVVAEKALYLVDLKLLDFSDVQEAAETITANEQVARALGYDFRQQDAVQSDLRRLAGQSTHERAAAQLQCQLSQSVYSAQPTQPIYSIFHIVDIKSLYHYAQYQQYAHHLNVSTRTLKIAAAYKRALYDMMRGSIDASNRQTVRDVVVPPCYGLAKLNKDQEAQIEQFKAKLADAAARREKEKKQLSAMCAKLKQQALDLCTQFDQTTLKAARDRRFQAEILTQAHYLYICCSVNYAFYFAKFSYFYAANDRTLQQTDVAQHELKTHLSRVEEQLKQRQERHLSVRAFNKHIDGCRKQLFSAPELLKFFYGFKLNYYQIRQQIRAIYGRAVVQRQGLSYGQIAANLEQIYATCPLFSKETLQDALQATQTLEKELLDKFADNIVVLNNNEPIVPTHSGYERLNALLQLPPVYNVFYIQLISKLFPIQQLPDFAQQTTKPNFQAPEMVLFDVCRCVKTLLELVLADSLQRFSVLQNHTVYAAYLHNYYSALVENNIKQQQASVELVNRQFLNPSVAVLFKAGQVEHYREWDVYFDRRPLQFMGKSVLAESAPAEQIQPNFLLKDDSLMLIIDIYFIKSINQQLSYLGEQRVAKLYSLSKFRQKQEILNHEIKSLQHQKADCQAQAKDFQLIRVSKDMHGMIRENISINAKKAREVGLVQRKLDHARRAYYLENDAAAARLRRIPRELTHIRQQNEALRVYIDELAAVNEQRRQALPEFAAGGYSEKAVNYDKTAQIDDEALKKFRRIAALRKMRELSKAYEEEMQFLIAELEKLRNRTYPSFY